MRNRAPRVRIVVSPQVGQGAGEGARTAEERAPAPRATPAALSDKGARTTTEPARTAGPRSRLADPAHEPTEHEEDPVQQPRRPDPDAGRLAAVLDTVLVVLLAVSLTRYLSHHPGSPRAPWVLGLSATLALVQLVGPRIAGRTARAPLAAVTVLWVVLVLLAPSFAWCAVPLVYTALRVLPARAAIPLVAALTALVVLAQARLADDVDPGLVLLPPAVAALATAVFLYMERQTARQQALIDDLVRTRRELAATERREGMLAERGRLAMEIHDTLAQGLSSQRMLLQAADRTWETDPATARAHVRTAGAVAARNLAEARRFVHDLAPAELADGSSLDQALDALAARECAESGLAVRFHLDGAPVPLGAPSGRPCCGSPRARSRTSGNTPVRPRRR